MRDLKHLAYFEELLREANNALVRQACAEVKNIYCKYYIQF